MKKRLSLPMLRLATLWLVTGGRANAQSAMDNLTIRD